MKRKWLGGIGILTILSVCGYGCWKSGNAQEAECEQVIHLGAVLEENVSFPEGETVEDNQILDRVQKDLGIRVVYDWIYSTKEFERNIDMHIACDALPEALMVGEAQYLQMLVDMMEINISCPNVNAGFLAFGQDAHHVEELTAQIKKIAKQPVIMKLTPNVTDITEIAKGAEAGGADAVSLINTLTGMKIDINRKTFALANKTGGVSGPIVKPIAVRMVYQVAQAVNIPIIGMGGISCAEDAIEFILAGASAVSVGTANFHNPAVTMEVIDGIEAYMKKNGFNSVKDMVGIVK